MLGVQPGAASGDVRAAYLRLLRAHHPDVAGAASTATAAHIIDAYRTLARVDDEEDAGDAGETGDAGDTLVVDLPPDEAFLALVDAAGTVGVVTYVDADAGLFEAIVEPAGDGDDDGGGSRGGPTCSLVVTLQGRATGVTEAFCTLVALGAGVAPPVRPYVARLAGALPR